MVILNLQEHTLGTLDIVHRKYLFNWRSWCYVWRNNLIFDNAFFIEFLGFETNSWKYIGTLEW